MSQDQNSAIDLLFSKAPKINLNFQSLNIQLPKQQVEETKEEQKEKNQEKDEKEKKTIYIGNVHIKTTKKEIKKILKEYGIQKIRFRNIPVDRGNLSIKGAVHTNKLLDYCDTMSAYAVLSSEENAQKACKELSGIIKLHKKHLFLTSCTGFQNYDDSVFIGNLSKKTNEEDLFRLFSQFGEVINIRIVKGKEDKVSKGFAFLQFKNRLDMKKCFQIQGTELNGKEMNIKKAKKQVRILLQELLDGAQRRIQMKEKKQKLKQKMRTKQKQYGDQKQKKQKKSKLKQKPQE